MRKLSVTVDPIVNRIYAGHLLKDGETLGSSKQDVTGSACGAVCDYIVNSGKPVIVACYGVPKYEITVRKL